MRKNAIKLNTHVNKFHEKVPIYPLTITYFNILDEN